MFSRLAPLNIILLACCLISCEGPKEVLQLDQTTPSPSQPQSGKEFGTIARALPENLKKLQSTAQTTSTNSLADHWRYTAEDKNWRVMVSQLAYFRDVYAGVETVIVGATDGETWYAEAIRPDGSKITWTTVRFYSNYGGNQDCFVSPFNFTECYTRNISIIWYTTVRCAPTGIWTMNFYNNGVQFATTTFTLKPQIEAGKVPSGTTFNQGTYTDDYDNICKGGVDGKKAVPCDATHTIPWSIAEKGCFLTASTMVLKYHGVDVSPRELNTWLNSYIDNKGKPRGFTPGGDVRWEGPPAFARTKGVDISVGDANYTKDQALNLICNYGPIIIGTKLHPRTQNPGHWVVATGWDPVRNTWLINDPSGGQETTLLDKYGDQLNQIRLFKGPDNFVPSDDASILIRLRSPAEFILTDPQKRRLGRDPIKGISFNEIPRGNYAIVGLTDDTDPDAPPDETVELYIKNPIDGDYLLQVIGTELGEYLLSIYGTDQQLNSSAEIFKNIPTDRGSVHSYSFGYSKAVGSEINVSGGFDGGGQRPKDVNKFLSYVNPSESQTTLPPGTTKFPLHIFYGSTIIPSTFKAELNGVNIASSFNPVPGENQIVLLNLQSGRNVLVLSVDGNLPTRVATDTDRLVFKVQ